MGLDVVPPASRLRGGRDVSHRPPEGDPIPTSERDPPRLPDDEPPAVPFRGLALSLLALAAAGVVSLLWPSYIGEYSGLVWILGLVPVFLLAYYKGWRGTALAAAGAMATFTLVEIVVVDLLGQAVDWWLFGTATTLLAAVTLGTGWVSELLHRERRAAARMAYEDPLTLLPSRRALDFFLEKELAAARRGETLSVVFFDLDDFKSYNDRYGHAAGDRFLYRVGEVLSANTRQENLTGRYGGEEFLAILPGEGPEGARVFADRVRQEVNRLEPDDHETPTISAGVATWKTGMVDDSELLTRADKALYRAKSDGGDRVVVWESAGA